jgi:hypothetical protein
MTLVSIQSIRAIWKALQVATILLGITDEGGTLDSF